MLLVFELGWLASELWSVNSGPHARLASTLLTATHAGPRKAALEGVC